MKIYKHLDQFIAENPKKEYVVTIGNFDGVHEGHQQMLSKINEIKNQDFDDSVDIIVVTFTPHPRFLLGKSQTPFLLSSYEERGELLASFGIKFLIEIEFTEEFSTLKPDQFLDQYILRSSDLKKIFIGFDFSFGKNKVGNYEFIKKHCPKIPILKMPQYKISDQMVNSSLVRELIKDGDVEEAGKLLGHAYIVKGKVIKGAGRGQGIGFPTANLSVDGQKLLPKPGVYIGHSYFEGKKYNSLINIGFNPTFKDGLDTIKNPKVEVHILNFEENIYGKELKFCFFKRLRSEEKFSSISDLTNQIHQDIASAKNLFDNNNF